MFGRLFRFEYISAWKNSNIPILFEKYLPSKALQKLYKQVPSAKQKSLLNIFVMFNTMKSSIHYHVGCSFDVWNKSSEQVNRRVCLYSFCRAFHGASSQKKSRFYHLLKPRYVRNKKCCKHFVTSGEILFFVESQLLWLYSQYYDINWRMMKEDRIIEQCLGYQYI